MMNLKDLQEKVGEEQKNLGEIADALNSMAGTSGSAPSTPGISLEKHYRLFREYVVHEDALINKRLLWNINIQGFLFGGYGYVVQKLAELEHANGHPSCKIYDTSGEGMLVLLIPFIGIAVTCFGRVGIMAAKRAIDELTTEWDKAKITHSLENYPLPNLTGGAGEGSHKNHKDGLLAPKILPIAFALIWIVVLCGSPVAYYLGQRGC